MIEVSHLTKRYGSHLAVDDLNFTVENGVVYGFLGPNGAGKSTTMNILTGCLAATSGTVTIDGYDIFDEPAEAKRRIGYLPELPPLYTGMTVREYLTFVARAKSVPAKEQEGQLAHVMEVTGTAEVADRLIKNLSKGFRQRVGIAQAILGDPAVVILDEPTVGLDPIQIIEIRDLIHDLGKEHTVILSSHILSEVQAVCDQILIINRGRLVACGEPQSLEEQFAGEATYKITAKAAASDAERALKNVEGVQKIEARDGEDGRCDLTVTVSDLSSEMNERLSFAMSDRRIPVLRLEREQASLEDVFLTLTAQAEADREAQEKKGGKGKRSWFKSGAAAGKTAEKTDTPAQAAAAAPTESPAAGEDDKEADA
ncbi:MAG: ABC transporter ATP-binding protein [Oscillospiraceae bacterium]|nr:ABC transporter ATP-binding protein [Oscillospiraceae bacterium]